MSKYIDFRLRTDSTDFDFQREFTIKHQAATLIKSLSVDEIAKIFKLEDSIVVADSENGKEEWACFRLTHQDVEPKTWVDIIEEERSTSVQVKLEFNP